MKKMIYILMIQKNNKKKVLINLNRDLSKEIWKEIMKKIKNVLYQTLYLLINYNYSILK